jgi:TetR/AcrR family transcriptional regulator, transcriptional repressor for nem operon
MNQRKKQPVQTRQAILLAAGEEFSRNGYAGSGLGGIVVKAGLTKGALFHHFPDKRALAEAWIGENLASEMAVAWFEPLERIDSLEGFRSLCRSRCMEIQPTDAVSSLVALTSETAADAVLGPALEALFFRWREALAGVMERGKLGGWIHRSIQPELEAAFLVSAFSGFTVTTRTHPDPQSLRGCANALEGYLETLRAQ